MHSFNQATIICAWVRSSALPARWWQRACFRAELRADLRDKPDFLRDIGIGLHEAQAEASRFFWEPLLLKHR
jgi:uncharacterized protein YjiS (DUF1127 family)